MTSRAEGDLDLRTICNELGGIKHKWIEIGVQLGISRSKLMEFRKEDDPLSAVVDFFMKNSTQAIPVSWKTVASAVESAHVGETGLADKIKKKYCQQERSENQKGSEESNGSLKSYLKPNVLDDLRHQLKKNLKEIKNHYAAYVRCICLSLNDKGVTVKDLRTYLLSLDAFQSGHASVDVKQFSDKKDELEKKTDIEGIFALLVTDCASFLNYEIFQSIISEYDIDTSQKKLSYPEHVKAYVNKHRLSEFYEINPMLKKNINEDSECLILKFDIELTNNIGTLKERIEALADILGLKPSALRLLSLKEGCVIVKLFLSASVAGAIFTDDKQFSSEQIKGLRDLSVMWLKYNGYYFDFREDINQDSTATMSSGVDKVRYLLQGVKFDSAKSENSLTSLISLDSSIKGYDFDEVRKVLTCGGNVDLTNSVGWTPLHYACVIGHVDMAEMLISEFSADMTIKDADGRTALMIAALAGHAHLVQALLYEYKCPLHARARNGWTVLHFACAGGNASVVRILLPQLGIIADSQNDHPLHVAACYGEIEVVLMLLEEFGCDLKVKGSNGQTLLHSACKSGNVSLVRTLMHKYGAKVNARDDKNNTPLHVAAYCGRFQVALQLIHAFHCDFTLKGHNGMSLLHNACLGGNVTLVRALIQEFHADVFAYDDLHNTPLNVAAYGGNAEVAFLLIEEFGCDPSVKGYNGRHLLHDACAGGNVDLVGILIRQYHADLYARDNDNSTPLHEAALNGKIEIVLTLTNEFGCDPNVKGYNGKSLLHYACAGGNLELVRHLIFEHGASIHAKDNSHAMPMFEAALNGKMNVVLFLISIGCDPHSRDSSGKSLLHCACKSENISLLRCLILEHQLDCHARDNQNRTPFHLAAMNGQIEVVLALLNEFDCDPSMRGASGRSLLHDACQSGNVELVRTLICEYNADVYDEDNFANTPLHVAASNGRLDVVVSLVDEFGCDPNIKHLHGRSLLHYACAGGSVSLVRKLICMYEADVSYQVEGVLPLHEAAASGKADITLSLINEFGCDPRAKDELGRSVLHYACAGGNLSLVKTLILRHKVDVSCQDYMLLTPLHIAASSGCIEVVLSLISEFGCNPDSRDSNGRSLLHIACAGGKANVVRALDGYITPLVVDNDGDTPLHICSALGHEDCVNILLSRKAPILIRNNLGKTPRDIAYGDVKLIIEEYIEDNKNKIYLHYDAVQEHARQEYSKPERLTRLFVIGNPEAGKSSLIHTLKEREFQDLETPDSTVSPHTAGIIPSIITSKEYGRVLFFDFAGDPEYYSSHAAILENIASSRKGDNIFVIVVDLRLEISAIRTIFFYWLSFIQHQKLQKKPSLIVVGSHSDLVTQTKINERETEFARFCSEAGEHLYLVEQIMLDCRNSEAWQIEEMYRYILKITQESSLCYLSFQASILLGLLGKDFHHVTACSVQTVISHIISTGIELPKDAKSLLAILHELHEIGLLFMVRDTITKATDTQIVLNTSQLTNKVHELLFSNEAINKLSAIEAAMHDETSSFQLQESAPKNPTLDIGIISDDILKIVLPQYITKECLLQLQYCQEITGKDVGSLLSQTPLLSNQTFLFFPALISLSKSDVSWLTPPELSYSIGLLVQCTAPKDYYPPRFLHILLLKLIFNFSLSYSAQTQTPTTSPNNQRCCTMWKTGVHWFKKNGVECMVELVNTNKGVLIITKSPENMMDDCIQVFKEITGCVLGVKSEYCHSITPQFFLLDSTEDDATYLSESNLSAVNSEETCSGPACESLVSLEDVPTQNHIKRMNQTLLLHKLTLWNAIFPIDSVSVLRYLKTLPLTKAYELGSNLDIPQNVLETVQKDYNSLVRGWMSSSRDPPCWWHLVRALKRIHHTVEAADIDKEYGVEIQLQMTLLSPDKEDVKPDQEFLELFAGIVNSQWLALASILLGTSKARDEDCEITEELSPQDLAFAMLKKWNSKADATYGQLCQALKSTPLFH